MSKFQLIFTNINLSKSSSNRGDLKKDKLLSILTNFFLIVLLW